MTWLCTILFISHSRPILVQTWNLAKWKTGRRLFDWTTSSILVELENYAVQSSQCPSRPGIFPLPGRPAKSRVTKRFNMRNHAHNAVRQLLVASGYQQHIRTDSQCIIFYVRRLNGTIRFIFAGVGQPHGKTVVFCFQSPPLAIPCHSSDCKMDITGV